MTRNEIREALAACRAATPEDSSCEPGPCQLDPNEAFCAGGGSCFYLRALEALDGMSDLEEKYEKANKKLQRMEEHAAEWEGDKPPLDGLNLSQKFTIAQGIRRALTEE